MTESPSLTSDAIRPAQPERLTCFVTHDDDQTIVTLRQRSGGVIFLSLWLLGWTVGCVALAAGAIANPGSGLLLFGIPFWASWVFVAGLLVWRFTGREVLTFSGSQIEVLRHALIPVSRRVIPLDEVLSFRECTGTTQENEVQLYGIEMLTLGRSEKVGFHLPERERLWLVDHLNSMLQDARNDDGQMLESPDSSADEEDGAKSLTASEVLTLENTLEQPPSDCSWRQLEGFGEVAFTQRGRLQISSVLGLLFINAFWNGIVLTFVACLTGLIPVENGPIEGAAWWGMLVFLIPFEVIGLGMVAGLLWALAEPFRTTTLSCEWDRLSIESRWPCFRRQRDWTIDELLRLELRRSSKPTSSSNPTFDQNAPGYELALVGSGNVDVATIPNLTNGEARWIARGIFTGCRRWFKDRSLI